MLRNCFSESFCHSVQPPGVSGNVCGLSFLVTKLLYFQESWLDLLSVQTPSFISIKNRTELGKDFLDTTQSEWSKEEKNR